jgi:hypothetical protein
MGADQSKLHVAVQVDYRSQRDVWRRVIGEGSWRQPESDAADPETLYGFFRWAKEMCPADRYLLMFWGHSRSMFGLFTDADPWEYVAQTLTLTELRTALKAATDCIGRELDIVVFKDCYMSTLETASELKGLASYLVASQSLVPIEGWPYSKMLGTLIAHKDDPKKAGMQIVGHLEDHYSDAANREGIPKVPYALLDTSKSGMVDGALTSLVDKLVDTKATQVGKKARKAIAAAAPRKPGDTSLVDVHAMCRKLKSLPGVKDMTQTLERTVFGDKGDGDNGLVLQHYPAQNGGTRDFGGVSLFYYPATRRALGASLVAGIASRKVYEALEFKQSRWDEIALEAMPAAPPQQLRRFSATGIPELARQLVPLMVLEQLQTEGFLEQLQREAYQMARTTIAGLVSSGDSDTGKPQGFATGKPQGFATGKPQGFATGKPQGFGIGAGAGKAKSVVTAHTAAKPQKSVKARPAVKRPRVVKLQVVKPGQFAVSKRRQRHKEKAGIKTRRANGHTYESVVKSA